MIHQILKNIKFKFLWTDFTFLWVTFLFLLSLKYKGQSLEELEVAYPGNIFGIGGIGGFVAKTGTIASSLEFPAMPPLWQISVNCSFFTS